MTPTMSSTHHHHQQQQQLQQILDSSGELDAAVSVHDDDGDSRKAKQPEQAHKEEEEEKEATATIMMEDESTLNPGHISDIHSGSRHPNSKADEDVDQPTEDSSKCRNSNSNFSEEKEENDSAFHQYGHFHSDTLNDIWKPLQENTNHHHNNDNNESWQVAIQQTTALLSEHYQALMKPAQQAMIELEQTKMQLGLLQESHQVQEREVARLKLSEKQAQASIAVRHTVQSVAFIVLFVCLLSLSPVVSYPLSPLLQTIYRPCYRIY
jgi:hypothetical protein